MEYFLILLSKILRLNFILRSNFHAAITLLILQRCPVDILQPSAWTGKAPVNVLVLKETGTRGIHNFSFSWFFILFLYCWLILIPSQFAIFSPLAPLSKAFVGKAGSAKAEVESARVHGCLWSERQGAQHFSKGNRERPDLFLLVLRHDWWNPASKVMIYMSSSVPTYLYKLY